MMNNPECIYIWVNPEQKVIAICACESSNKDALKVPTGRNCEIFSTSLFEELMNLNVGLQEDHTYRLNGVLSQGQKVARFSILENLGIVRQDGV